MTLPDRLTPPAKALCAIHQPNFFPWLGYFDKVRRAGTFVFLDCVDYPRSGSGGMGSWSNRVKIDLQAQARWVGAPLVRAPLGTPINEIRIDDSQPWREKLLRTLSQSYRKAPGHDQAMALLEPLIRYPEDRLAEFNMHAIKTIAPALGLFAHFVRQSELQHEGTGTRLLVSLLKSVNAEAYLCGGGAGGYQEDDLFAANQIKLVYQAFTPVPYGDPEKFIPGLSVLDFLMKTEALSWRREN